MHAPLFHLLAQTPPAPAPQPAPVLSLDRIFWLSVFAVFLITIISALLRRLAKDKALHLFHEYHVAFFSERRGTLWGDLLVSSQGVELLFDQAFLTRRKIVKSSALLYEDEFTPMICMTRSIHGLTPAEAKNRSAQIHKTFNPSFLRRSKRLFRNLLNTMRDAITKTMSLVIGRMSAAGALAGNAFAGTAISTQANDITALTNNVVSLAANAYEPLLEHYIGRPVVLEINLPAPPGPPPPPNWVPDTVEFPGYLVDYTQKFIAVFNVDHTPVETIDIHFEPGQPAPTTVPELKITITPQDTIIKCEGKDAFVLCTIKTNGDSSVLGIAMIPGTTVILASMDAPTTLTVERTRQIDLIVPRTRGRVRYGSLPPRTTAPATRNWLGTASILEPREFLASIRDNMHAMMGLNLFSTLHSPRDDAATKTPPPPPHEKHDHHHHHR